MPIEHRALRRAHVTEDERIEVEHVSRIAQRLYEELSRNDEAVDAAHVYRASSSEIQKIVSTILTTGVGFGEEIVLTPQEGFVTRARPDFYYQLGPGRGIIAEVERGGTVTNNHDLKDLWKAHIAANVQHLLLVVPIANWNEQGRAREKPFVRVVHRLEAFFGDERREVDVLSCHIFGYGRTHL